MDYAILTACVWICLLSFAQNSSFTIVSRARNRNDMRFHLVASVFSNGVWFLTFRQLLKEDMSWVIFPFYTAGTVSGSIFGAKISQKIEQWLGAESDSHLKEKVDAKG